MIAGAQFGCERDGGMIIGMDDMGDFGSSQKLHGKIDRRFGGFISIAPTRKLRQQSISNFWLRPAIRRPWADLADPLPAIAFKD